MNRRTNERVQTNYILGNDFKWTKFIKPIPELFLASGKHFYCTDKYFMDMCLEGVWWRFAYWRVRESLIYWDLMSFQDITHCALYSKTILLGDSAKLTFLQEWHWYTSQPDDLHIIFKIFPIINKNICENQQLHYQLLEDSITNYNSQ